MKAIVNEIPYKRDRRGGYILGSLFAISFYFAVPLLGKDWRDLLPATFVLLAVDTFYALLGLLKYFYGFNRPKNLAIDLLFNYLYLWRRDR